MTIIQIAGTSGSGKSHLMRSFLDWSRKNLNLSEVEGGYEICVSNDPSHYAFVLGRYDVPTGGCDTIHDIKQVYGQIDRAAQESDYVLYEGLFVMNQTRGPELASRHGKNMVVLQLTTPLATCLSSINQRRAERGAGELANKKNTIDNYKRAENYCFRMRDAGARVFRVSRDEGLLKMLELLGGCIVADRTAYWREYYQRNKASISARKSAWRKLNRSKINAQRRCWHNANRAVIRAARAAGMSIKDYRAQARKPLVKLSLKYQETETYYGTQAN